MADEQWLLKEDGYLNVDTESRRIIYHPNLNVILVFSKSNDVKVLDVNSGVILQSCAFPGMDNRARGKYLPEQDRILFWNGRSLGLRADYNGVLLLDTILQTPIIQTEDNVKIELLLSEAILFLQSITSLEEHGEIENTTDVSNELTAKITEAQKNTKKGIKAQKWNTICIELPHSSLKMVANSMVIQLKRLDRHIPALAIASAINERLTELQMGARIIDTITSGNTQRFHMFSEAVRRQTFEQWPHMDYKWALPDQMAQAGFYHQPSATGDDRAMCFTCSVCLVSWEKTDEPWSEHERHSPNCPFVKGEYTQNVPLAITYATCPAIKTDGFDVISNGDQGNIICTGKSMGEITVWNVERLLKSIFTFQILLTDDVLWENTNISNLNHETKLTALCTYRNALAAAKDGQLCQKMSNKSPLKSKMIGTKIVCGVTVQNRACSVNSTLNCSDTSSVLVNEMNNQNEAFSIQHGVTMLSEKNDRELLLIVYELTDKNPEVSAFQKNMLKNLNNTNNNNNDSSSEQSSDSDNNKKPYSPLKNLANAQRFSDNYINGNLCDFDGFIDLPIFENTMSNSIPFTDFDELIKSEDDAELIKSELCDEILKTQNEIKNKISSKLLPMVNSSKLDEIDAGQNNNLHSNASSKQMLLQQNNANNGNSNNCGISSNSLSCHPIQYIHIITSNSYEITDIIPSADKKFILAVLKKTKPPSSAIETINSMEIDPHGIQDEDDDDELEEDQENVNLILYSIQENGLLNPLPVCVRALSQSDTPVEICMLPTYDNNGRKLVGQDTQNGVFVTTCADGSLKMMTLTTLKTISTARIDGEKFISATYCKSLERLCGCTENGSLHFYSFYDLDADSGDDREEENLSMIGMVETTTIDNIDGNVSGSGGGYDGGIDCDSKNNINLPSTSSSAAKSKSGGGIDLNVMGSAGGGGGAGANQNVPQIIALKSDLSVQDLKVLYSLTLFDEMLTPYAAEVPGCWSELVQAQKQRRHPQNLRPGDDTHLTKTWRLHNDATSWDEHVIEITLPKPSNLGHVDFKFSLYQQCPNPPTIQVTLLKQNSNGLGYRMKPPNISKHPQSGASISVDENIDFNIGATETKGLIENPVLNEEYLQAHNAEIIAGPFELASCMDLCDQGGLVVLTSPKLFKAKGRNFLLHIKTMADPAKDGSSKTRGCDWLHEISITLRGTKGLSHLFPNERLQRCVMLESNLLLINLLKIASTTSDSMKQNLTLDILFWIVSVRLARFRYPKLESTRKVKNSLNYNAQQVDCIKAIEENLTNLILSCIVHGNRTTAHKCVKIIMTTAEGAQNLPADKKKLINFEKNLELAIQKSLPHILMSKHSGAVRWFMLLISGVSTLDSQGAIGETCFNLLMKIVGEMENRFNPYSSLLKTRFGLYGTPFESELFDVELPLPSKLNSLPITIASVKSNSTSPPLNQSIDLKHFCVSEGTELRILPFQFRQRGIGNHMKGLLEVEPLHFTCLGASEATRIENMDAQSASSSGNIIEDIIFEAPFENIDSGTNMTTNSSSAVSNTLTQTVNKKLDEKTNVQDDMMNNVKNILVDKIFYSAIKKHKLKGIKDVSKTEGLSNYIVIGSSGGVENDVIYTSDDNNGIKYSLSQFETILENETSTDDSANGTTTTSTSKSGSNKSYDTNPNKNEIEDDNFVLPWHKLLSLPQKQMIVIERMHSGARRYVTLDFGHQILLTDLIIPACEDLMTLFIDIWSFEEEEDIIRLVVAPDIGIKTLVLSDLQPPPICRYMKITVTGRYGMSATRCKIPIGSFFGHPLILEEDSYADPISKYVKAKPSNIPVQLKVLHSLFEDVNCRYSLSSSKLSEMLEPMLKSEMSNISHMQAYLNRNKESEENNLDYTKLMNTYEECTTFQLQLNIIRNVIERLEGSVNKNCREKDKKLDDSNELLASLALDKLKVLSECLIEALLHFIIDYGIKNVVSLHSFFDPETCETLFNTLVVFGDAHIQLATSSLLVRMCCFQPWWGDFLTNIFTSYYSSQNSKIFPQDRVFFLLTYLGRKSIAMGTCRNIVIDAILKTLAKLLAPLSPRYRASENDATSNVSSGTDLQLISWLLLFLSVCIDDGIGKKTQNFSRWDFMSGEADMSKAKTQLNSNNNRSFARSFKKRLFQTKQYNNNNNNNNLAEKLYLMHAEMVLKHAQHQNELQKKLAQSVKILPSFDSSTVAASAAAPTHPATINLASTATNKPTQPKKSAFSNIGSTQQGSGNSATSSSTSSSASGGGASAGAGAKCGQPQNEMPNDNENPFDKGLRSLNGLNALVVVRGLVELLLGMDFTCNMDLFLLTCKVIARLVSACQPSIQLSKIMTNAQLQQLIRIAVWKDQQHPWAVHAITCLLQDILEADKNYKQSNNANYSASPNSNLMDIIPTNEQDDFSPTGASNVFSVQQLLLDSIGSNGNSHVTKDLSYADAVKYNQLPSLMECDDTEMEDILDDILERGKNLIKKANNLTNRNGLTLSYRSVSSAKDSRLEYGLESNIEVTLRRLTMLSSLNLFASLPQIPLHQTMNASVELAPWPENIIQAWSNPEYNQGMGTNLMLMFVFDNIFSELHLQDSWLNLEQVLQLWLTLNGELSEKSSSLSGFNPGETPKIPFGSHAVHGLLSALSWHPGIKLRAWCLSFQCLTLACNPHFSLYSGDSIDDYNENYSRRMGRMGVFMVNNPNFEKMLLRFFSGSDMNSANTDVNRYAGPTICKLIHELFIWLEIKSDVTDMCYVKKKLNEILLRVVLHLVQPGGSISNQQGPIDAQSQLIKELITFQYEKTDLGLAMSIIESVSYLIYNNISNIEKVYCQTSSETNNSNNVFGSLFATVLGSENSRQSKTVSDNTLLVGLLKLSSVLVQTALPRRNDEPMSTNDIPTVDTLSPESQTDEIKAEQQNNENRVKIPCVADTVLLHSPTMTRLLGSLSHCSSSSFVMMVASSMYSINNVETYNSISEPQTVADAVFQLLLLLSKKATRPMLIVKPLYFFLANSSSVGLALPKLQLSEPFLRYILKVLETPSTVSIFTDMGGIGVLCTSLVRSNRTIINMQPNLVSMIMQHMTKSPKSQASGSSSSSSSNALSATNNGTTKKPSGSTMSADELINFAPFCTITSANPTAQPADVLIQAPIASHRRARSPAWSYLFYPNESHVDLTITLPSAVLLREIHLQPHLSTLATCPSAVAIEITKDVNLGPVPICQPLSTVGMTCIKLKFAQPEIATSIVIRLYRPRDSSNIGLTQISILGTTTFGDNNYISTPSKSTTVGEFLNEDESIAKSSLGWLRILAQCFSVATYKAKKEELSNKVIQAAADVPGFLEACCSLLNVTHSYPNITLENLETVLLRLGLHSRELGLELIDNLLKNSIPQTFKLCNEPVSDLLYDLCVTIDSYTRDRIQAMIEWVRNLYYNRQVNLHYTTNPYNGFVKCLASVLWTAYSTNLVPDLSNMITKDLFDAVYQWTLILENDEPLKVAMDAMLCSICCIRPEMFPFLLQRIGVLVPNLSTDVDACISDDRKDPDSMTDDVKQEDADTAEWYSHLVIQDLSKLSLNSSELRTIAVACQSPLAVQQLLDSGLPRLLISAILDFCYRISREQNELNSKAEANVSKSSATTAAADIQGTCLTDSDKAEEHKNVYYPLVNVKMIAEILEFFSEICSEGHMRDWLGSYEGSVFWKPLLDILCNNNPFSENNNYLKFAQLEESMIKFLSKVSSCHPKNQEVLTINLISVIRKPVTSLLKTTISGFTRRLVLQLLLESEKILISVRSDFLLQRKDQTVGYISNHPSKRPNAHHLLFYLRTHTKCQDILENCVSSYMNILPPATQTDNIARDLLSNGQTNRDTRSELLDMGAGMGFGMEFLSVAAGVTAKDKRFKEVKNQAAVKAKDIISKFRMKLDETQTMSQISDCFQLIVPACPGAILTSDTTIAQILAIHQSSGISLSTPCITLNIIPGRKSTDGISDEMTFQASDFEPLSSPLQIFSSRGGLSLLAHYLPIVYTESAKINNSNSEKEKSPTVGEWVKVEPNDDIYEDVDDTLTETSGKISNISSVPPHSLAAFGLFLRLPAYSDVLLRDKIKAQCLLRLVLGVTGDGEGNEIYSLSLASSLPTLPFEVFRQLLDCSPLTTDDGVLLRRMVIEVGAVHLVLNCLSVFTHHSQNTSLSGLQTEIPASIKTTTTSTGEQVISDDKSHVYWAKGTGFGTGSTQQSWNVEQALLRQKSEEEHVTVLLEVLSSYINPGDKIPSNMNTEEIIYREINDESLELPPIFLDLLQQSCLISALSSYLRNDSVLDITRHIPLYRAILKLLRAIALSGQLSALLSSERKEDSNSSIAALLQNMKTCVDTYASRLKVNKKSNIKGQTQKVTISLDDGDDEGLALLIPDIQETASIVQNATYVDPNMQSDDEDKMQIEHSLTHSVEQRYLEVMKRLQFETFEMITEIENGYRFVVSHHFENNVRMAGDRGHPARVKRLAQETVTLSTSLPLSYSSSVFVRCDNDRLDIMKVLITGPSDTPYANGCFEFDVYFPADYPNSPMMINLETTGRHTVRFNPNLYNDGKVCLSVLNTWHGRPEEKWNAQTSSFLQVLVSIQSLILVPEPYFNEPGFERSRGTPSGTHSSREYNSNIYQACVRWAMLEQIKNPNPCFKEVIHTHFWVKRHEICNQIENWIMELSKPQYSERSGRTISYNSMVLRRQYKQLREELAKLPVPPGLEDLDTPFSASTSSSLSITNPQQTTTTSSPPQQQQQNAIDSISINESQQQQQQQLHLSNSTALATIPSTATIKFDDSDENSASMQIDIGDQCSAALTLDEIL